MTVGFRGMHGVTDHIHVLIAIAYEPVEGTLVCKMSAGDMVYHANVPERIYHILTTSPYAGSYYRKHVKDKYPVILVEHPPNYQPKEKPFPKKLPKVVYPEMPLGQGKLFL